MSGTILDTPNDTPLNDKDKTVLNLIFGDSTCINDPLSKTLWYIGLGIVLTIVFWILIVMNLPMSAKVIIFFLVALAADWVFNIWRQNHPLCF